LLGHRDNPLTEIVLAFTGEVLSVEWLPSVRR